MSVADHERARELLAQYDAMEETREHLYSLYEQANAGEISYSVPDELSADINEGLRDLLDEVVPVLRRLVSQ